MHVLYTHTKSSIVLTIKKLGSLRTIKVDERDSRNISELYFHQTYTVEKQQTTSEKTLIKRGVRLGCVYLALDEAQGGIQIN